MIRTFLYLNLLILFPKFVFAATRDSRVFKDFVDLMLGLINPLITVVAGLALLVFFWGLVKFISNAGDAKSHEDGRQFMVWGIIALFVMVSVLGILNFFSGEFGFGKIGIPRLPES